MYTVIRILLIAFIISSAQTTLIGIRAMNSFIDETYCIKGKQTSSCLFLLFINFFYGLHVWNLVGICILSV